VSWWVLKTRQALRHVLGRITPAERAELAATLTLPQASLFAAMHRADQRHGLDVAALLRSEGHDDPDLQLAALLHDCSKGSETGLLHRVAWSLGERYGEGVLDVFSHVPGFAAAFGRLRDHAEESARLALEAGCSKRTVELIRHQADPVDPEAGVALRLADEAC
jgi:hypothetical protein